MNVIIIFTALCGNNFYWDTSKSLKTALKSICASLAWSNFMIEKNATDISALYDWHPQHFGVLVLFSWPVLFPRLDWWFLLIYIQGVPLWTKIKATRNNIQLTNSHHHPAFPFLLTHTNCPILLFEISIIISIASESKLSKIDCQHWYLAETVDCPALSNLFASALTYPSLLWDVY